MILIVVKFPVKPELADDFIEAVEPFTSATRAEPGNKWFGWSRGVDNPHEFVLVEAFNDDAAEAHVTSDHFKAGLDTMRPFLTATPKIISRTVDGDGWDAMGELRID